MLFQTGSRRISKCTALPCKSRLAFRTGVFYRRIDVAEFLEIAAEHLSQFLRLGIVSARVRPRLARKEYGGRNSFDLRRNSESEHRIGFRFRAIELAMQRGVHHRACV